MNRLKNTGLVLCGLVLGFSLSAPAAQAVESLKATLSTNRILVDGQEVRLTAYNINGNNYVKLRDIGEQVGFNVYWDSDAKCVQVESSRPYTGAAPAKLGPEKPVSQPEVTNPAVDVDTMKQDIVDRTNAIRREQGISALTVNAKLMQAAQVRADEMAASGIYSHTRPDGRKSNTVTDSKYTGENLHNISELYLNQQQKTLSEAVVNLWSNSKAHADNMTSSRYGEIGVGLAQGVNQNGFDCWYCVQVFLLDGCEVTWVDTPASK
ncbi:CAP domain-containing protein [Hominicoprocola fusiformis]